MAAAHIALARRFEPDFLRVMNDHPYPLPGLLSTDRPSDWDTAMAAPGSSPWRSLPSIDRPADWANLSELHGKEAGWGHQLEALELIVKALKGQTWVVETVYSPWTLLSRLGTRELMVRTARENPGFLRHALDVASKSLANYVRHALATGIQGIFYCVTEARHDRLSPAEYQEWCAPYDRVVLNAAAGAPFNILHIHGQRIYFEGLQDYPVQAASWSHFHTGPGLARGLAEWGRPVLGGLDEVTLHRQTPGSLSHYFQQNAPELWLPGLILAPGCSLRPDISPYVLDAVRAGVESLRRLRPKEGQSHLAEVLERPEFDAHASETEERPRRRSSGPVAGEIRRGSPPGEENLPHRDRGPRRFDGPPLGEGEGRPYRDRGPRRFDGPTPGEGEGRPYRDRGPRRFDGPTPGEGEGRPYRDRGPRRFDGPTPGEGEGRPYRDRGPRRFDDPTPGEGEGRPYRDRGPRRFEGPPYREGGPRRPEGEGRPYHDRGPRRFEGPPPGEGDRGRSDPAGGPPEAPPSTEAGPAEPRRRLRIPRPQAEPPVLGPPPPAAPESAGADEQE